MTIESGNYQIKNHATWTVLDESTDGQRVIHGWQQTNEANQHWEVMDTGDGLYTIRNLASGLFLHAESPSDGTSLVTADDPSTWYLDQQPNGEVYIIYPGSGHVVDLDNGNVDDGTTINLWGRNDDFKQQQWFFEGI